MSTADSLAYPGEFEVLSTKAHSGFWESGRLRLTNYQLAWTPSRFSQAAAFAFPLDEIASVRLVRSVKALFLAPALRITLVSGAVYEILSPGEDIHRLHHLIDDYRLRERYRPGSLFGGGG